MTRKKEFYFPNLLFENKTSESYIKAPKSYESSRKEKCTAYFQGLAGPAGFPGRPGVSGKPGLPGSDGRAGIDGKTGIPGDDGVPGLRGLPGKPGLSEVGEKGEPGLPGMKIIISGLMKHVLFCIPSFEFV